MKSYFGVAKPQNTILIIDETLMNAWQQSHSGMSLHNEQDVMGWRLQGRFMSENGQAPSTLSGAVRAAVVVDYGRNWPSSPEPWQKILRLYDSE